MRRLITFASCLAALFCCGVASASAAQTKVVSYLGVRLTVPASWPVYRLSSTSTVCVRFNRHAVYLGQPGATQSCPAQAVGRTEAILAEPASATGSAVTGGSSLRRVVHGVAEIATWNHSPSVIEKALGVRSLSGLASASRSRPSAAREASVRVARAQSVAHAAAATPGQVYNGLGFDACSTPSIGDMSAWLSSPFRAVGVYIGGPLQACPMGNLNASWVTDVSAEGWHLIPIYVGLQAPNNSCGCSSFTAAKAATDGASAADDAILQAQSLGLGAGNPIYYDMEQYTRSTSTSNTVRTFLAAWTQTLHSQGYYSGVYSSESSGIVDLVADYGTSYTEPDDIWIAAWNNSKTVSDPDVPAADWANGQRLHQYAGANNAKYGGVTINIDDDYLDGATAAAGEGAASTALTAPVASGTPTASGTPLVGQTLTDKHARWSESPLSYSYQWQLCNAAGAACASIKGATGASYKLVGADQGHTLRVVERARNSIGTGAPVTSPQTAAVASAAAGYWLFTAEGNVYNSLYEPFYGSPVSSHAGVSNVSGMASTVPGAAPGYWLTTQTGTVYHYGKAGSLPALRPAHPVLGIVASPTGGYWLYTAYGNIYNSKGTKFYGSPASKRLGLSNVAGMASSTAFGTGKAGYWVVTRAGAVYSYGGAKVLPQRRPANPVIGIVASPTGGYWFYTADGNIYNSKGTKFYGSPASSRLGLTNVTGMATTADGKGYWVLTSTGAVYPYGDAASYPALSSGNPMLGIAAP